MKKNIAITWGGFSSEKEISEKSAAGIYSFIDKEKYNPYKVKIDRAGWEVEQQPSLIPIDKNDFSFIINGEKVRFDFVYNTIHGTPGEDGKLQGYLDLLSIPYSGCGVLASALTFNKYYSNNFLKNFGINVADSILLKFGDKFDQDAIIAQLGLPLFVKPNMGGSSFATTKVKETQQLKDAVEQAFREGPEVIIEEFLDGIEVTCGCFNGANGLRVLPLTKIVTENEFFDYGAKYLGEVEEITPAPITKESTLEIQRETKKIYRLINAKGIIRVDYIITENLAVLLEVNTTPGMTATSFIPQQAQAAGLTMRDIISEIIETELNNREKNQLF